VEFVWVPTDHEQAEDRIHRIGQGADSVFAYYLIAPDTIEENIVKLLLEKNKTIKKLIDGKEGERFFGEKDVLNSIIYSISGRGL